MQLRDLLEPRDDIVPLLQRLEKAANRGHGITLQPIQVQGLIRTITEMAQANMALYFQTENLLPGETNDDDGEAGSPANSSGVDPDHADNDPDPDGSGDSN